MANLRNNSFGNKKLTKIIIIIILKREEVNIISM
jgi:hypothetical protein